MPKLNPFPLRDWQYGMVSSVSNGLLPDNYPKLLLNCYTDEANNNELGNIKGTLGYTIIGNQIEPDKKILGLHNYISADETTHTLIASVNDIGNLKQQTYYLNGSSWIEIGSAPTAWTADASMRFLTFLNRVYVVDGTSQPRSWSGTGTDNWDFTNLSGAPKGGHIIIDYQDRIHIGKGSSIFSSSDIDLDDNSFTWVGEELPVSPDDNDSLSAFEKSGGILLAFKKRAIFTWNGVGTETDPLYDIGAVSQEAVITARGSTFFFGETYDSAGIFKYTGQYPQEISRPVKKWLTAMDTSDYGDVTTWKDEDAVYFSIGDVTVEGVEFSNIALRFCISKQSWSVLSTPSRIVNGTVRVDSSSNRTVVIGDNDGQVHTWNSGNTFNGSNINSRILTKELEFGSRYTMTSLKEFAVYSNCPQGASIRVLLNGNEWVELGSLKNPVEIIKKNLTARYFQFEITYANDGTEPFVFDGFEFFNIETLPYAT